ncbi:LANO_0D05710g1_1 [Lachancea nothofagi CBS 11611]|uniref:LANO_0D05710g1_1 n=1 Tax=Lachancea nothofagi CBS 11611 TaxID=1266666 RepID=A0A1G4JHD7_9SACH|nr:LANO_0D05710g1_1 [Lachancea nothofagi CBS 11611]
MSNVFQRVFLSRRPAGSRVADLETSLDPSLTLRKLRNYTLSTADACHYGFLGSVLLFVFVMNPAAWIAKIAVYLVFGVLFMLPATSQFFFNALPIFTWLALYFTSSSFSAEHRPPITVQVLPAIETILYGDNLSDILAASLNKPLDFLAWIPYGLFHFGAPFVVAIILFLCGPPTILRGYAFAFGYMNLFGVMSQNLFPAAPPWYKILYGLSPANYAMKGSPGGLGRIDQYLGISLYTDGFSNSAVIFGALPSLHSGCSTMEALFFSYVFPKLTPLFIFYVCWLWWSTMYLTHHYFVDLIAGSVLSYAIFQYTKYFHLPLTEPSEYSRWSYAEVKKFSVWLADPLNTDANDIENIVVPARADMELELNSMENSEPPSIFDHDRSVSRSSATSNTSVEAQSEAVPSSRPAKHRID